MKRLFLVWILFSCLLAMACTGATIKQLGPLQTLHSELTKKFGDQVYVNVNQAGGRSVLTVTFINSALNEKSPQERFQRAAQAAKVVKATYNDLNDISAMWIGFVRQRTRIIVFHYSEGLNFFPFDKNGEPVREPETTTPDPPLETTANYHASRDQSDVLAYGIQLEGRPGQDGVTVLPSFKTTGDVNVKKGPPPKTVQFDFASYSSKSRFDQTEMITFVADDKPVLEIEGTFHGNDAQFCYLPVPYSAFRKMLAARQLAINLGDKRYLLTPRQLAVLKEMTRYVNE